MAIIATLVTCWPWLHASHLALPSDGHATTPLSIWTYCNRTLMHTQTDLMLRISAMAYEMASELGFIMDLNTLSLSTATTHPASTNQALSVKESRQNWQLVVFSVQLILHTSHLYMSALWASYQNHIKRTSSD